MDLQSIPYFIATRVMTDPLLDIVIVLVVVALVRTIFLSRRISLLTRGSDGSNMEPMVKGLDARMRTLEEHGKVTERALNNLDERVQSSVRGVTVRHYDPFENAGGQQSFTSALVNEEGDGVLISGIHARDSVRVYAKEVKGFSSNRELSEDEQKTIEAAKDKLK